MGKCKLIGGGATPKIITEIITESCTWTPPTDELDVMLFGGGGGGGGTFSTKLGYGGLGGGGGGHMSHQTITVRANKPIEITIGDGGIAGGNDGDGGSGGTTSFGTYLSANGGGGGGGKTNSNGGDGGTGGESDVG